MHYFFNNITDIPQERNSLLKIIDSVLKIGMTFVVLYIGKATSWEGFTNEFREGYRDFIFD